MTKKTRLIILLVCVVCFLIITPILILYSMGERFDFAKMQTTSTGGIYVKTFPVADQITVDSKVKEKPGLFSTSVFVQSLLPKNHTVLIQKNGYYDYSKTLPVQEKQVTKLENVLLIKNNLSFSKLADKINYFSIAPNNQNIVTITSNPKSIVFNYSSITAISQPQTFSINQIISPTQTGKVLGLKWSDDSTKLLIAVNNQAKISYYLFDTAIKNSTAVKLSYLDANTLRISFNPQNSQQLFFIENGSLYSEQLGKATLIIKNVAAYKVSGNNIIWLGSSGLLYNSDLSGKLVDQLTIKNITISATQEPRIFVLAGKTFLQANSALFLLSQNIKTLIDVTPPETNYQFLSSPDNQNLIFWNSGKIYLYSFVDQKYVQLYSGANITDCQWLNNSYIVFTAGPASPSQSGDKIIISEIDYRGNINAVTLHQTANKIFFNQQDGKLYILTANTLVSSEKITQ